MNPIKTQQNHMQSNWHFSTYQWPMRHWTCPFRLLFHQTCIISFILHLEAFRFTEFIRFQNVPIYMWIDIQDSLICQFLRYRVLNNRWSGKVFQLNSFWYRDWQWQWTVKLYVFSWYFGEFLEYWIKNSKISHAGYIEWYTTISMFWIQAYVDWTLF